MTQHTVVAVYDSEADAAAAVRDLESADVPTDAISQHTKERTSPMPTQLPTNGAFGAVFSILPVMTIAPCTVAASNVAQPS
jgi:hypothetical protein